MSYFNVSLLKFMGIHRIANKEMFLEILLPRTSLSNDINDYILKNDVKPLTLLFPTTLIYIYMHGKHTYFI